MFHFVLALAPRGFALLFVVRKGLFLAADHLGGGFEHGLEMGLVDLCDILAPVAS
jgi:hypothetical protein